MKKFKTFYEAKKENCSALHQIKASHVFGTYIFLPRYTEIYRYLFSKCFENVLFRKRKCAEKVHCKCYSFFAFFFSDTNRKHACCKNLKCEESFWLCCGSIFYTSIKAKLQISYFEFFFFWSKFLGFWGCFRAF